MGGTKALTSNHRVCYDCSFPILNPETLSCTECGGIDLDGRRARPKGKPRHSECPPLPHPWNLLNLEPGGTVLLSGGPGSGKTTITCKCNPTHFATSEQQIHQVYKAWWRIVGKHTENPVTPELCSIANWEELKETVSTLGEGDLLVVDSVSQLSESHEAAGVVKSVTTTVQKRGARAIFIAQYRKDGVMLGPNELRHLVDVVCEIPNDPTGLRRLSVSKNRFGDLFSKYFSITNNGVEEQAFPYAYSVEGSAGKYHLHLYPMKGSVKLDGIFQMLEKVGAVLEPSVASAAIQAKIYPSGFALPPDIDRRRKFAEDHGLSWIGPEEASEILISHGIEDHV